MVFTHLLSGTVTIHGNRAGSEGVSPLCSVSIGMELVWEVNNNLVRIGAFVMVSTFLPFQDWCAIA